MPSKESLLLSTSRFKVWLHQSRLPNGNWFRRPVIRHPGAVVILPLVDAQTVCLIRNYRPAVGKTLLELPAGTREPNESPLETARRELEEETGYRAGTLTPVGNFFTAPGILDELMHAFVAHDLKLGQDRLEADESIESELCSMDDAIDHIRQGRIEDAKTIATILMWHAIPQR